MCIRDRADAVIEANQGAAEDEYYEEAAEAAEAEEAVEE